MESSDLESIAQLVRATRMSKGLTQQELSASTGLSLRSIQRIENAEVLPRSYTLQTLAKQLDIDFGLLSGKVSKSSSSEIQEVKRLNKAQKVVLTIAVALMMILLTSAFIFQSATFPESQFEFALLLAGLVFVYALILVWIWK